MDQEALALHGQQHAAPCPCQKRLIDQRLEALHLHAQGGLAAADPLRGPAEGACFRHDRKAAQQGDIQNGRHQKT